MILHLSYLIRCLLAITLTVPSYCSILAKLASDASLRSYISWPRPRVVDVLVFPYRLACWLWRFVVKSGHWTSNLDIFGVKQGGKVKVFCFFFKNGGPSQNSVRNFLNGIAFCRFVPNFMELRCLESSFLPDLTQFWTIYSAEAFRQKGRRTRGFLRNPRLSRGDRARGRRTD